MDPFEVRMQFLSLLRRLNASQQSIQKVVAYALKYFSRCGEDLWDCVVEECQKGSINARINILYLLDSLCETSLLSKANSGSASSFYVDFVARDLATIVDYVVPEGREGLINLMSAVQILENWRNKRVLDPQKVEDVLAKLDVQKAVMHAAVSASSSKASDVPDAPDASNSVGGSGGGGESATFSRNEIFQRIEEDRERHKRLRERRWVQPVSLVHSQPLLASFAPAPDSAVASTTASAPIPSSTAKNTSTASASVNANASTSPNTTTNTASSTGLTLDIEFDNEWETTSDWNEDDDEAVVEENALCYPNAAKRLTSAPPPVSVSGSRSSIPEPFASVSGRDFERDTGRSYDLQKRGPVSDTSQFSKSVHGPNASTAIRTSNPAPTLISTATVQPKAASKRVRIDRTRMYERRET